MASGRSCRSGFARVVVLVAAMAAVPAPVLASAEDDLAAAQRRANQAAGELDKAQVELAQAEDNVAKLQTRVSNVDARVARSRDQLRLLAVRMYVSGTSSLTRLLRMGDANDLVRAQQFSRVVAATSTDALGQFRAERENLEDELAALRHEEADRADALRGLQARRAAAAKEVDRLSQVVAEQQARAAEEAARRQASAPALAGARPAAPGQPAARGPTTSAPRATSSPTVIASGDWVCPVQGPHAFSDDYGAPRGGGSRHQGNDILAPRGTPVVANVSGRVQVRDNRLGGLAYFLYGDDGNEYYGAHLDSHEASGQVSAGTVIGTVGDTGDAKGGPTHLHFEIHPGGGSAVNPYPTLSKYC